MTNAVYIHIPFCTHICHYCDFNKVFLKGQPVEEYLAALEKEMRLTLEKYPPATIKTVYIGGGTPTALNEKQLGTLLSSITAVLPITPSVEFTIEANPGDLTKEKLHLLKMYGINRLSIGVQTFNNELLKRIGRTHTKADVYKTIKDAKDEGFSNISVDLMYRLPSQTLEDIRTALNELRNLKVQHASIYSLIVEPKTVFYNLLNKGKLFLPTEDEEADMFEYIMHEMESLGFRQYEISNFTKEGFESKHNLVYWNNEHYYGFGAGAHGYLDGERRANIGPVNHYIRTISEDKLPILRKSSLAKKDKMEEEMFLGLRKMEGVSLPAFQQKFGEDLFSVYGKSIQPLLKKGLLTIDDERIKLSKRGIFLGNEVFQEFLL